MNKLTRRWEKTILLNGNFLDKIKKYTQVEPTCEAECLSEDKPLSVTVSFDNGYFMDIKCCGVQFKEGQSNRAWTEATLLNPRGEQVASTEPHDDFEGPWELGDNDGNVYAVTVCRSFLS